MELADELLGPGEMAARVGFSTSGLKKLERQGVIPPAMRLVGSGRRVWKVSDVSVIQERIEKRRSARAGKAA